MAGKPRIVLFALRDLHFPVLLPVYRELAKQGNLEPGFMAPPYQPSDSVGVQMGLSEKTLQFLRGNNIPFWGHEKQGDYACIVTADVCYDQIDGWGPIVCVGHGTISKSLYFMDRPYVRRENFATTLCVPGPWYAKSYGRQVFTRVVPTGFSKMDELANPDPAHRDNYLSGLRLDPAKKTILFAPTFNLELTSLVILFEEWAKLNPAEYQVLFKLHGATHEELKGYYRKLVAKLPNTRYIEETSLAPAMLASDLMVSDVSSAYVEYFVTGRPVIVVNNPEMTKYPDFHEDVIEYKVRDAAYQVNRGPELQAVLRQLKEGDPLKPKRTEYARTLFAPLDGKNSARIADEVMKVVNGEVGLKPPRPDDRMTVYIPPNPVNPEQIEKNIRKAMFPPRVITAGKYVMPSLPFICMTGEHDFPRGWDFQWFMASHFNPGVRGLFGPVFPDTDKNTNQRHTLFITNPPKETDARLQALYKYGLYDRMAGAKCIQIDGLIFSRDLPQEMVSACLAQLDNPEALAGIAAQNKMSVGVLPGFFCTPTPVSTATDSAVPDFPRITIVTPNFNQGAFLEKCIRSILNQGYPNLEYIIIDGGSTDNSVEVIRKYEKQLSYWVSEKDKGQTDAINKGLARATGVVFNWINSDDWLEPEALQSVSEAYRNHPEAAAWVGACRRLNHDNSIMAVVYPNGLDPDHLGENWNGRVFYQPSCFMRTEAVRQAGGLDPSLRYCMDYDLYVRLMKTGQFVKGEGIWTAAMAQPEAKTVKQADASWRELAGRMAHHGFMAGSQAILDRLDGHRKKLYAMPDRVKRRLSAIREMLPYAPENLPESYYDRNLVCLTFFAEKRNLPDFLRQVKAVFEAVLPRNPGLKFEILTNSPELFGNLFQSLPVSIIDKPTFTGHMARYRALALLQPAQAIDPDTLTLAQKNGLPILAVHEWAESNVLVDGRNAFVSAQGNLFELSYKLNHMVKDPQTWGFFSTQSLLSGTQPEPAIAPSVPGKKPRILFVCHDFPPYRFAGAQLYAKNLATALITAGLAEVEIFHPVFRDKDAAPYQITRRNYEGIPVFELAKEKSSEPEKIFNKKVAEKFVQFLKERPFDLIHFHGLGQLSLAPIRVAGMMKIPLVITLHDFWFLCDRWHMIRENQDICTGPETTQKCADCFLADHHMERGPANEKRTLQYHEFRRQFFRETFELFNAVLSPSLYLKNVFNRHSFPGVSHLPLGFVYNDVPAPLPENRGGKIRFGYAGQIILRKGINFLIMAFRAIQNPDIELHIWGRIKEGDDFGSLIKKLLADDPRIQWHGEYSPEQLGDIIPAVDVVVVPTLMDNFPIAVQEAFIFHRPVIASNVGGVPEIVSDGKNGFLVPPGDIQALSECMKRFIADPGLIKEMSGRISPVRKISHDAADYGEIYSRLLGESAPAAVPAEQQGLVVQFYVFKNVHWPMFEELYHYLKGRPEVREIILCLPDLPNLTGCQSYDLLDRLFALGTAITTHPSQRKADVTFIADTIAGKVKGCGKIVNVGHGTISKGYYFTESVWTERENWVDLLCVPGPFAEKQFKGRLKTVIRATGMPKLDPVFSGRHTRADLCRKLKIDPAKKIVLYAPTFNKDLSSVYLFQERFHELAGPDRTVLIKLHGSTLPQTVSNYRSLAQRTPGLVFIDDANIAPTLAGSDVMVSDVSSAFMEFMALDKPVVLFNNPNASRYHGYNPDDIEWKWRDMATQAGTFDELKQALSLVLQQGDHKSGLRKGYAAELFADLAGGACARVWEAVLEILDDTPSRIQDLPTLTLLTVLTPDNLFLVRNALHKVQFYSIMPIELSLVVCGNPAPVTEFVENLKAHHQFEAIRILYVEDPRETERALLTSARESKGEILLHFNDSAGLYKNFDYVIYTTFRSCPELSALTGLSHGPQETDFRKFQKEPLPPLQHEQIAYRFINWYQCRATAAEPIREVPALLAFRKNALSDSDPDFASLRNRLVGSAQVRIALSLYYSLYPEKDLALYRRYLQTQNQQARLTLINEVIKTERYVLFPDVVENLFRDLLFMNTPKKKLINLAFNSRYMRNYEVKYMEELRNIFSDLPDIAQELDTDIKVLKELDQKSTAAPKPAEVAAPQAAVPAPLPSVRVLFYFFKNVHLPILLPIYKKLKNLHPEIVCAFGWFPPSPEIRAGLADSDLEQLKKYNEQIFQKPGEFRPDVTFIADAVYELVQGCGKIVQVGHGVLSKGQYYTDTALARREEKADLVCVPGRFHEEVMRKIIRKPVMATGMAKMDALFSGQMTRESVLADLNLPADCRYVLFAPTFNDELSAIPFVLERIVEILPDTKTRLVVKLHGSTKKEYVALYERLADKNDRVLFAEDLDITPYLALCDVCVSDVSSAMMEFAALDKPVVLFNNPYWESYKHYNKNDIEFKWRDIGIQAYNLERIKKGVARSFNNPGEFSEKRKFYADQLFANRADGKGCERIIENSLEGLKSAKQPEDKPETLNSMLEKAVSAFEKSDFKVAAEYFDKAMATDPSLDNIQLARAISLQQTGRPGEALEAVRKYLLTHPGNAQAINVEAQARKALGL